jgi:ribosome-binding factor A
MEGHRAERVSEMIREELSEMIGFELTDPRLGTVQVTSVRVAPDLRFAQVSVKIAGSEEQHRQALDGLEHASNFLRRQLAARLDLRRMPELHFEEDQAEEVGSRIEQLLKRVHKQQRKAAGAVEKMSE